MTTEKILPLFVVIPANVHFNKAVSDKEVRIYGYISALANSKGYCYATNKYLADTFGVSEKTVQRAISNLTKENLLKSDIIRDSEGMVVERRLYITLPEPHNDGMDKNVHRGMDKNVQYNNINNNNMYGAVDTPPEQSKTNSLKAVSRTNKKSKITIVDEDSAYTRIINHFNSKDNTKFKANNKEFVANIDELLKVYSEEEILGVIDYVREHNYNEKYFRPSTVFRISNFERSYEFYVKTKNTKKACTDKVQAQINFYYVIRTDLNRVIKTPVKPNGIDDNLIFTSEADALNAFENMKK